MARDTKTPGCPRCRLDLIEFTVEVKLPRFTMHVGEQWYLPQSYYAADGSAQLGHGIAPVGTFRIVERDASRASHNGLACPGNPTIEQQQGACDGTCGGAKLANGYCTRCAPNQPIDRCTVCGDPAHATETDDDGRCVRCMRAAGIEPLTPTGGAS